MVAGTIGGLPELFPGTHPFCIRWFPIQWRNPDGSINYSGDGTAILGHPITAWRYFENPNKSTDSVQVGATVQDPKLGSIPNGIQGILWFHQKDYKDWMGGMDTYPLPDGTSRTTGSAMSTTAWNQLLAKLGNEPWPL